MSEDVVATIIRYAAAMFGEKEVAAAEAARRQGWLDEEGRPTKAGRELVEAIADQKGTRSVFRIG